MLDTCTITSDPDGAGGDTLDPVTLELTPPPGEPVTVYAGPVLIYDSGRRETPDVEGSRSLVEKIYTARIPWDSVVPAVGAVLTVTAAAHDQRLVGRPLRVVEVLSSSHLVSRDLVVQDRGAP